MPQAAHVKKWRKAVVGLAALGAALSAAGAAQAQFYFDSWGSTFRERWDDGPRYREARPLDRADIRAILGRRGFEIAAPIARNNDVYIVQVLDPAGRRLRLIVDAFDGTILRRFEANVGAAPPPPPPPRGRDFDDDYFDAPARPPREIPGDRYSRPEIEPDVIPGVGPSARPRPEPRKPATARAEPKPAAPKPPVAQKPAEPEKPVEAARPDPAPKSEGKQEAARPAPKPAEPAKVEAAKPEPAKAEEKSQTAAAPRVIPLYKKPDEAPAGTAAETPK